MMSALLAVGVFDERIMLDPQIRNWVLLPIALVMFMQGFVRQYASQLLKDKKKIPLAGVARAQLLKRSKTLRQNAHYLPPGAVHMRKQFLLQRVFPEQMGEKAPAGKDGEAPAMPAQDPMAMMGMMKQNVATMVPQMVLMGWVSYFFSGFVMVKLPFGLTEQFKPMMQRGIMLQNLDTSYVSSLSWYFMNVFGLRGLFGLVLGANNATAGEAEVMRRQMEGAAAMQQPDPVKLFGSEKTELEILDHTWEVPSVERRLLKLR